MATTTCNVRDIVIFRLRDSIDRHVLITHIASLNLLAVRIEGSGAMIFFDYNMTVSLRHDMLLDNYQPETIACSLRMQVARYFDTVTELLHRAKESTRLGKASLLVQSLPTDPNHVLRLYCQPLDIMMLRHQARLGDGYSRELMKRLACIYVYTRSLLGADIACVLTDWSIEVGLHALAELPYSEKIAKAVLV